MDGAGGQEDMDARPGGVLDSGGGAVDVVRVAAGQTADDRAFDLARDGLDALEIAGRRDRKAGLDHVDAEIFEGVRHLQLLGQVHAGAGGLFAVAQGRVEDDQAVVRTWSRTPENDKSPGKGSQGHSQLASEDRWQRLV